MEVTIMNVNPVPENLPLVLSVLELASILHIGRNTAYGLVNT